MQYVPFGQSPFTVVGALGVQKWWVKYFPPQADPAGRNNSPPVLTYWLDMNDWSQVPVKDNGDGHPSLDMGKL